MLGTGSRLPSWLVLLLSVVLLAGTVLVGSAGRAEAAIPGVVQFAPGGPLELQVTGRNGVPASATSVVLNVTVTQPTDGGYVTVYPCGEQVPATSSVNYVAGQTVPNLVVVRIGAGGRVCMLTTAPLHLVADATGFFTGSGFRPLDAPRRLLDTRLGAPGLSRIAAGKTLRLRIDDALDGSGRVTGSAVMNLTAVGAADPGYLTVFACDQPRPVASNVNYLAGEAVPNLVLTTVSPDGFVCIYSMSAVDVVVDLTGVISTGSYTPIAKPARVVDTRSRLGAPNGRLGGGAVLRVPVKGQQLVGADAVGVSLNVTVTGPSAAGFVTVFPCDTERPMTSNLNFTAGQTIANHVIVAPGASGEVCVFVGAALDLVVDLAGGFRGSDFVGTRPVRLLDSRDQTGFSGPYVPPAEANAEDGYAFINRYRRAAGLGPVAIDLARQAYVAGCLGDTMIDGCFDVRTGFVLSSSARAELSKRFNDPMEMFKLLRPSISLAYATGSLVDGVLMEFPTPNTSFAPVMFPGSGATVERSALSSSPMSFMKSFTTDCPGWSYPMGAPIFVTNLPASTDGATASVQTTAGKVDACVITGANYPSVPGSPQAGLNDIIRAALTNSAVIVPRTPLPDGSVDLRFDGAGTTLNWRFTVASPAVARVAPAATPMPEFTLTISPAVAVPELLNPSSGSCDAGGCEVKPASSVSPGTRTVFEYSIDSTTGRSFLSVDSPTPGFYVASVGRVGFGQKVCMTAYALKGLQRSMATLERCFILRTGGELEVTNSSAAVPVSRSLPNPIINSVVTSNCGAGTCAVSATVGSTAAGEVAVDMVAPGVSGRSVFFGRPPAYYGAPLPRVTIGQRFCLSAFTVVQGFRSAGTAASCWTLRSSGIAVRV